jgi:D-serine dehydratase
MVIRFTLQGLLLFLACALVIAAGILLLPILWNIKKAVGILRSLVETNQEFINKTIKTIPGIFENVEQTSTNVRETTDKLKVLVPVILQEVECATDAAKGSIELAGVVMKNIGSEINEIAVAYKKEIPGFMDYFHIVKEVLQIIYRAFFSSK